MSRNTACAGRPLYAWPHRPFVSEILDDGHCAQPSPVRNRGKRLILIVKICGQAAANHALLDASDRVAGNRASTRPRVSYA